jgi:prepilin-type N-terminal cleavage/methylation domain-containing protein
VFKFKEAWRSERGYTFIELLVAITVLALVFVPLAALFTGGYMGMVRAGRRTAASNLCREKIEEIKANGYSYYLGQISTSANGVIVEIEDTVGEKNLFKRETTLECVKMQNLLDLEVITISVKVSWKELEIVRSVKMESYLSSRVMPE